MRNDYGSLRRRTRDSGWQWLLVGVILGMGFATVVCVGGYAFGVITFSVLESDTETPDVQVEPNQTDVANLATRVQQTMDAQQAPVAETAESPAGEETEPGTAAEETALETPEITATPSPLPESADSTPEDVAALPAETAEGVESAAPESPATGEGEAGEGQPEAALAVDTPVVGTPPVGQPTQTISFGGEPIIPTALDAIKTDMVPVTGGTFMMGTTTEEASQAVDECALYDATCPLEWVSDSTPAHQVTVDSFQIEAYEVSVAQYVAFLNWLGPNSHKNQCQGQPCAMTTDEAESSYIAFDGTTYSVRNPEFYSDHPITWVTWWGAEQYCNALNRRLPTEAEWERAARGPQNYVYPWGFEFDAAKANSSRPAAEGTEIVTSYPNGASPYGVFNMAGNVSEWVADWYQFDYYSQAAGPNPQGPISGTEKVLRGGSWDTVPLLLRAVHRQSADPTQPTASTGFRCVSSGSAAAAPAPALDAGAGTGDDTLPSGAPTLAPAATQAEPAGPTATLDPGT
jgi:sulfatase modifying factor 1